ncbi:hypothetical protein BGZ82_006815 [Podila clonocystis]|nr:hypothetical protein BGZ82_006815 [Podila clonocystis]
MHHALNLTEILLRIATYLSDSELSVCATTCTPWSDLFLPLLYRTISLKWNSKISLEALEKHAHLVRNLSIAGNIPAQFYWIPYTRLTHLSLDYTYRNNRWDLCAQLIRCQQQSLEHMALAMPCKASKAVWEAIAGCSRLDSLSVEGTYLDAEHFPYFWDACSQVTQLTLQCMNMSWARFIPPNDLSSRDGRYILGNSSNEQAEFDRLWRLDWPPLKVKQLTLAMNNSGMVLGQRHKGFQFRLLEKCPDLVSFDWRSYEGDTLDFDLLAQAMAPSSSSSSPTDTKSFPHLSRLSCSSSAAIGGQIASIVESLVAPLQLLHVYQPNDAAGGRIVRSIHRHLSSLISVDLSYISGMDRATVQIVLTSAPLLEVLVAGAVSVQDMAQGPPWVSTRLRRLSVFFDMGEMVQEKGSDVVLREKESEEISGSASNVSTPSQETLQSVILATSSWKRQEYTRHVFRQLSVLTSLVQLQINRNAQLRFKERGVQVGRFLDFSLRGGLEILSTLKRLENVRLPVEKPVCQCYGVEDVEWMLRAWPRLQGIDGELHPSPVVYDELKHMMESGGVLVVK